MKNVDIEIVEGFNEEKVMNINTTLAEYFQKNNPINEFLNTNEIVDFLKAEIADKYKLSPKLINKLAKSHGKEELSSFITELYKVEKSTMKLTGKRDHVIHALNTFLLGIYINDKYLNNEVNVFQWKLSALFHDIAYPIEISQEIMKKYCNKLPEIKIKLDIEKFSKNECCFQPIQRRFDEWRLDVNVIQRYQEMIQKNKLCHGILSSLTVLYLIDKLYQKKNPERKIGSLIIDGFDWNHENFENHIVPACSAIYLHNLKDDAFKNIEKNRAPLPYLLKLCDELQDWDRPKLNMPIGDSPEKYDIFSPGRELYFKVKNSSSKNKISKKIECLNDPNVKVVKY